MKKFIFHGDGRLKTGRVSVLVFLLVMFSFGVIYKVSKPLDQTLLAVSHLFEPMENSIPDEQNSPSPDTDENEETQSSLDGTKRQSTTPQSKANAGQKMQKQNKIQNDSVGGEKNRSAEEEISSSVMQLLSKETIKGETDPEKASPDQQKHKERPDPLKSRQTAAAPISEQANMKSTEVKVLEVDREKQAISLESADYFAMYQHWQKSGKGWDSKVNEDFTLEVEDLRNHYALFQMKPVAVAGQDFFIDLADGSRVPAAALDVYSQTVFEVADPWKKWGGPLTAGGMRKNNPVEVRYYMYDFIRNAIFSRALDAVIWSKKKGLISPDTQPSEIKIKGRVYTVEKNGGGRFGVFVPHTLNTVKGQTIKIDPACYEGSPDVKLLLAADMLSRG